MHDNGGEFVGPEFQSPLQSLKIKDTPTSSQNPQASAICEWMHQTVGNILQTLLYGEPSQDVTKAKTSLMKHYQLPCMLCAQAYTPH